MPEFVAADENLEFMEKAADWLRQDPVKYGIIVLAALLVLYIVYRILTRKKKTPEQRAVDLGIEVSSFDATGPPTGATALEFYNLPVQLVAIVLAPAGRLRGLPPPSEMGGVYDAVIPELSKVIATHRPLIRRWSPQLSVKGFSHVVYQKCPLPGDNGKGTPWSTVAGVFEMDGQPMVAALILRTESKNSHGQRSIDEPHQWLDCLRVKE
jgi:hypothetical protein